MPDQMTMNLETARSGFSNDNEDQNLLEENKDDQIKADMTLLQKLQT